MGSLEVWRILDQMIAEFRARGVSVPEKVIADLKSAKTILSVTRNAQESADTSVKIDGYLASVESFLVSEGEKRFGCEFSAEWLAKLSEAGKKTIAEEERARFVPGFPRKHKWIRVEPSKNLPLQTIKTLAKRSGVPFKTQRNGYLLIYGDDKNLKDFVKKMATRYGSKPKK